MPNFMPPASADFSFDYPITSPQEALLLGNGDLAAMVTVASHQIHLVLGKNDCWDARFDDYVVEDHLLRQEDLIKIVEEYGWSWPVPNDRSHGVPDPTSEKPLPPGLKIPPHFSRYHKQGRYSPPTPKRVAEIIIDHPGLSSTAINGRLKLSDGCLSVTNVYNAATSLTVEAFIHRSKNVVYLRVVPKGRVPWYNITLRKNPDAIDAAIPAPSLELLDGGIVRLGQKIPGAEDYDPFEWFVAARLQGIPFAYEVRHQMHPADETAKEFCVAVATSRESDHPAADCVELLDDANEGIWERNKPTSDEEWRSFWTKSGVRLQDEAVESAWYRDLYGLACNIRHGANCPGLNGNMIIWDGVMWHSDYHFNLNMQKTFMPGIPANHIEMGLAYADLIEYCLPTWHWIAENVYGVEGAMLELSWFPYQPYNKPYIHPFWREQATLCWTLQPLWWLWQYTRDKELLAKRVYPAIRDAAIYCHNYLLKYQKEPGGDLYPGIAGERAGWTKDFEANRNIPSDIASFRQCFRRAIEAAKALSIDADWVSRWEEGIRRLPDDEPLWMDNTRPVYDPEYRVYPAEDLDTTVDDPRVAALRQHSSKLPLETDFHCAPFSLPGSVRLQDENAFERVKQTLMANRLPSGAGFFGMVARTGMLPADWGQLAENFWMNFVVSELLLQSHHGLIQLFPVWPRRLDAQFENLRAVGGFLVSASLRDGNIMDVCITSEAGEPCTILWLNGTPAVRDAATGEDVEVSGTGDRWTFNTQHGRAYTIQ